MFVHLCELAKLYKMYEINFHMINEAVYVQYGRLSLLQTVPVVVNGNGVSQHLNCIVGA